MFAQELHALAKERQSGKLAEEFNRASAGMSSVVKASARKLGRLQAEQRGSRVLKFCSSRTATGASRKSVPPSSVPANPIPMITT